MGPAQDTKLDDRLKAEDRRTLVRYAALTAALFVPLLLAFASIRNLYPFAAFSGETIDLPPIKLTNALTGRSWSLLNAAVENKSFNIPSPHPANLRLVAAWGGKDNLPRAARLEDLLRAWGAIYNSRLPASSNQRLRSVRLDAYRWEGGTNGDYDRFVESWRAVL